MDKRTEIELLDSIIKQFGQNSYIGPWLSENRSAIVQDISNDLPINAPMPREARRQGEELVKYATLQAETIKADAEKKADAIVEQAKRQSKSIIGTAYAACSQALNKLQFA